MTKKIKIGDRVYYRAPRIADRKKGSKPEFTVVELYYGGTMLKSSMTMAIPTVVTSYPT